MMLELTGRNPKRKEKMQDQDGMGMEKETQNKHLSINTV